MEVDRQSISDNRRAVFTCQETEIAISKNSGSGRFLDEFSCEIAEYDDHLRSVRYTHTSTQADDALLATNYALVLAIALHQRYANGLGDL